MTKVVSRNPWVPKNFQPMAGLYIGNPFLFRGKFSVLSNDLTQRVRPQFPPATTKYSADYCPNKRRRVTAPTCAPQVTVAQSHEEESSQNAIISSDSDSSSDSEASCTDESISPSNATPAFIAPDISLSLPSHPQTSYSPPFVPASTSPLWRDPAITRLFMDQLRTYPQPSATSPVPPPKSSSKLWNHIVSLSRSLLGLFSSRAENKEGPLTLQDCCQPSFGSHSGRETQDPSPITWAPPAKIQAYIMPNRIAEVNISSVTFWKELGLRPASGQRNTSYICLTPRGPSSLDEMSGFMSAMRESYEACHLGKLMPMSFSRIDNGLCAIPLGSNGYPTTMENIAKLSAMLGAELAKVPVNTLPKNIILFYTTPESPSPSQAIWDIATCFRKLQTQVGNPAIISRIRFQIIPNQVVAQFHSQRLPLSFIPSMGLSIYSRLDSVAYSPAFALSQPPPAQIQYRMPRAQGKLFDYAETLHLSYSWGPAKDSVIAVWMDGRASVLDHCLLPITARAFSNEDFLVEQLWKATRRFQARCFNFNPRIAVTKLGTMEAGELAAWKRCISHIPGSCVMASGISCDLELFEPSLAAPVDSSSNAALLVLSDLHLPHARNVVSRAVGIMRADLPSSQWVHVVLLADSFQIASPPLPLGLSFRRVLAQLNDLAAFDSVMRFTIANPLVATTPRSTYTSPVFPLPWRWIQDASAHLKVLQTSAS
ncbi:hypothetical protein DSO57_1038810 [Entomophthora muscae]|uniref:Uncharacterized protein n=1 Tax=Entomophthora muscae TaxID=34485 RepID=A0ACC2SBL5_9FUNG|nr:hypothetical protein DSO57_1038810 [Entomophthora muscae]